MPRGPKVTTKTYHVPNSGRWISDGFTLRKITTGSGRNEKVEWQKRVSHDLYLEGTVEDVIDSIRRVAEGVIDAYVDQDYSYGYNEERSQQTSLIGWVTGVTEEEIAKATEEERAEAEARLERQRQDAERALANIRANFPELLDQG